MNSPTEPTPPFNSSAGPISSEVGRTGNTEASSSPTAGQTFPESTPLGFTDPWAAPSQVFSWLVVVFCAGLMMTMVFVGQFIAPPDRQSPAATLVPANLAGQFALGMESFDQQQAVEMLDSLDSGPVPQRLARLVILTELISSQKTLAPKQAAPSAEDAESSETDTEKVGPQDVRDGLAKLREQIIEANYTPTDDEEKLIAATELVVQAKLAGEPLPSDSESVLTVEKDLGFAGRVAAAWSSDDPRQSRRLRDNSTAKMLGIGLFFALVVAAAVAGLFVAAILFGCLKYGVLRSRWLPGSGFGFIHLEAFAVWFVSFFVAQVIVGLLASGLGLSDDANTWLTLVVFYIPVVVALAWLLVRHPQPWRALREVGFTSQNVFLDLGKALVTHLAFLPLLVLMMYLTVVLTGLVHSDGAAENPFAPPGGPSHPIQEQFDGQIGTVLALFLLAAVTAPLVEETVFRGLFYRYLRDVTHRQSIYVSVLVATLVNGFIFASIHPQGLLGIPALMTLAASMSIAREWSGGLVAPMAIHALNNGALVLLMSVMFAS